MREGWEIKKLGEVCTLFTDGDWIESKDQSDAGIRLIQTGNVGCGIFNDKAEHYRYISQNTFDRLKCTEIYAGDILISRLPDPIGRSCIIPYLPDRMITAVDCTIVRLGDDLIPPFLVHYTNSSDYNKKIQRYVTGAVRKRISRKNLSQIEIPIPPLSEQKRIVAELDLLSEVIAKKREQLTQLDALAQSLFYTMFGDPITNEKGWEKVELYKFAKLINGRAYKQDELLNEGKYPVLRVGNFFSSKEYYYSDLELSSDKYCNDGDLLYAWSASFGAKIWNGGCVIYHYHIWKIEIDNDKTDKSFLCFLLNAITKNLFDEMHGIAMMHLTKSGMEQTPFILPPLVLQQQFAEKIEAIEQQKERIRQSLAEVQLLFDSRMDYYFNEWAE